MRIWRTILTAIAVEALAILGLFALVAIAGPNELAAAQKYAEENGMWFGPTAGALLCLGGGWWVAKGRPSTALRSGTLLGATVSAIDIALIVAAGASFAWIFVLSNTLKIAMGAAGGWLAGRTHPSLPAK